MKTRLGRLAVLAALAAGGCGRETEPLRTVAVERGDIQAVVPFHGELEARHVERIAVGVQGSAVLAELVEEGARVAPGDVLARFDAAQIQQDLARQENECVRARQELDSLEQAELPLELIDMEAKREELRAETGAEERFLESARGLQERGLLSEAEVRQQERKVAALHERGRQWETRVELTRQHVHAARLAKARAALEAAERQRDFTARQLALCEVRAPVAGVATRVPLPVGLSVQAEILAGEETDVLWVPREAVEWRGTTAVVGRQRPDGRIEERVVETGLAGSSRVEIVSGLEEGDRVRRP